MRMVEAWRREGWTGPSGATHQKRTGAPPVPALQPLPLDPARLAHGPEIPPRTLAPLPRPRQIPPRALTPPIRALESLPRTPAPPVLDPEFQRRTRRRPLRAPEFLRRGLTRQPLDPAAPVHAASRNEVEGGRAWLGQT